MRILVLGDLNLDLHVKLQAGLPLGGEIYAPIVIEPGGAAGTFARTAAACGASVTFIGAVGADPSGDLLERTMCDQGVRPRLRRVPTPTGAVLAIERDHERSMICSRGANEGVTAAWVEEAWSRHHDHLHVSGYALLSPAQREGAQRAFSLAQRDRLTVSLDPPPYTLIQGMGVDRFVAQIPEATWFFPNASEGELITGETDRNSVVDLLSSRFPVGAMTLGPDGALAWEGATRHTEIVEDVVRANPTGAGDVYAAAFVTARLQGVSLAECNRAACLAAAGMLRERASRQRLH